MSMQETSECLGRASTESSVAYLIEHQIYTLRANPTNVLFSGYNFSVI